MSDFNLDDLRDELDVYAEPEKARGRSAVEERVIAGFEEIQRFVEKHRHRPPPRSWRTTSWSGRPRKISEGRYRRCSPRRGHSTAMD